MGFSRPESLRKKRTRIIRLQRVIKDEMKEAEEDGNVEDEEDKRAKGNPRETIMAVLGEQK